MKNVHKHPHPARISHTPDGTTQELTDTRSSLCSQFLRFYGDNPCPSALFQENALIATNTAFESIFTHTEATSEIPFPEVFPPDLIDLIKLSGFSGGDIPARWEELKNMSAPRLGGLTIKVIPLPEKNFGLLVFLAEQIIPSNEAQPVFPDTAPTTTVIAQIFNSAPFGVGLYNSTGALLYANPWVKKILDYGPDEMETLNLFTQPELVEQNISQKLSRPFETGEEFYFEAEFTSSTGNKSVTKNFLIPFKSENEKLDQVIALIVEVTREVTIAKQLRQTRNLMKNLLDNIPDNVYFKDTQSRFILISKAHANMLGVESPDEVIGKTDFEYYEASHALNAFKDEQDIITTGKALIDKTEKIEAENGSFRYASSTKVPMYDEDGTIIGLVGISRNITDRVLLDEKLMRSNESLEQSKLQLEEEAKKIERVNKELEKSRKELQEINASKDKFFSIIAHDLKSPFHGLLGLSSILVEDTEVLSKEENRHYLLTINRTLKDTYDLIENLLSWSRLQTGRMQMMKEKLNLWKEINSVITMFQPIVLKKKVSIVNEVQNGMMVYADQNMFHSIIHNLVSNAVKFTPSGGMVIISATKVNDELFVNVKDTGLGMTEEDQELIFSLDKNHSTLGTSGEKGTGLGILLVKEMMDKHNGRITVHSIRGKGTEFTMIFPLDK
jgi:PAS domain S-box-containing protein